MNMRMMMHQIKPPAIVYNLLPKVTKFMSCVGTWWFPCTTKLCQYGFIDGDLGHRVKKNRSSMENGDKVIYQKWIRSGLAQISTLRQQNWWNNTLWTTPEQRIPRPRTSTAKSAMLWNTRRPRATHRMGGGKSSTIVSQIIKKTSTKQHSLPNPLIHGQMCDDAREGALKIICPSFFKGAIKGSSRSYKGL